MLIAGDIFWNHEKQMVDTSITYSATEVAEIALDADRWRDYCSDEEEFEIIMDMLHDLEWGSNSWKEVISEALPFKTYGY